MGVATEEELPEGWSSFEKDKVIYEFRCPWGEQCKKLGILLYKSQDKDTVLDSAAMHFMERASTKIFRNLKLPGRLQKMALPRIR